MRIGRWAAKVSIYFEFARPLEACFTWGRLLLLFFPSDDVGTGRRRRIRISKQNSDKNRLASCWPEDAGYIDTFFQIWGEGWGSAFWDPLTEIAPESCWFPLFQGGFKIVELFYTTFLNMHWSVRSVAVRRSRRWRHHFFKCHAQISTGVGRLVQLGTKLVALFIYNLFICMVVCEKA